MEKNKLTKSGYRKLQEELRDLIDNQRNDVKQQLIDARAQGDLSENADYDAARARQAEIEGRIKVIESILDNCEVIEEVKGTKKVALGSKVTVSNKLSGKEEAYMIVGTIEADPMNGKISNACPLGEALIGKSVGDVVEVKARVNYQVEIVSISSK